MKSSSRAWPARAIAARGGVALLLAGLAACSDGAPDSGQGTATAEPAAPADGVFGRAARAVGGFPSVVTLEPTGESAAAAPTPEGEVVIDQLGLTFVPRHTVVHVGATVRFTNGEAVQHNVHLRRVDDGATVFNADTPPNESLTFVIDREGGYDLLCDAHPGMTGMVYATTAPYFGLAAPDGAFHVEGVPPGTYALRVWSLDVTARVERAVTVEGAATEVTATPVG
jgi:plastocyanin